MRTPVTNLDQRFSDPDAVATSWEETRRVLEDAQLSWITTVRADGRSHVNLAFGKGTFSHTRHEFESSRPPTGA